MGIFTLLVLSTTPTRMTWKHQLNDGKTSPSSTSQHANAVLSAVVDQTPYVSSISHQPYLTDNNRQEPTTLFVLPCSMSESLSTSWYAKIPFTSPPTCSRSHNAQVNRCVQSAERPRGHIPCDLHRGLLHRVLQDQSWIRQAGVMITCSIALRLGIWISA